MLRYVTILSLLTWVLYTDTARASDDGRALKIGEVSYSRSEIIADFLRIAFSDAIWNEDAGDKHFPLLLDRFNREYQQLSEEELSKRYRHKKAIDPWIADYLYYPNGWPKHGVVNKWTGEISIGIGWPNYSFTPDGRKLMGSPYAERLTDAQDVVVDQVNMLLPDVHKVTGLPAVFVPPDSPRDSSENFARIRIVPVEYTDLRNFFKTLRYYSPKSEDWHIRENEYSLWAAVPFTPESRSQVDGYLLPNPDNTLGMAVCKVVPNVGEQLLRALVSECILRSLGLPGQSRLLEETLVGPWNRRFDAVSLVPRYEGAKAVALSEIGVSREQLLPSELIADGEFPAALSGYDKLVASLLYCESIEPGMSKLEALRMLTTSCL